MEEQNIKLVDRLAQVIGEAGVSITAHYAEWFIWSSIAWMIVGVMSLIGAKRFNLNDDALKIENSIIKIILGIIGVVMLAANFGDLLAPQGAAIHQLIKDIRG